MARKGAFFLLVATGIFLSTMDSSMVNVALPFIMRDFDTTLPLVEWVVLTYLLVISITLLIWGKLSDRLGKGIIYLAGMAVFIVGALGCYLSVSLWNLVVARFIQGAGAAMMMSTGPAIIRLIAPQEQIGRWLGSLGISTSLGLMLGPFVGGYLVHVFTWRMIFLVTLPVSAMTLILGWHYLAGRLPKYKGGDHSFDILGAFLWAGCITLVIVVLNYHGSGFGRIIGCTILGLFLFLFILREHRQKNPLLPIMLLRQRYYAIAMIAAVISFSVLFFVIILMPFFLYYIKAMEPDRIGYIMMSIPVTLFVISPLSGVFFDRVGARILTTCGLFITSLSLLLLAFLHPQSSIFDICWRLALLGSGQSMFLSPNSASVLSKVTFAESGITSGLLATCRNLGMLVGVALAGMVFSLFYEHFSGGSLLKDFQANDAFSFVLAFRYTLGIAACLAAGGMVISSVRRE